MIRKRFVFYGSVQGVGFRWRARQAAFFQSCTGWCQNEPDGSVTMEIQGTEEQIEQVILAIEAGRYIRIEDMKVESIPPEESERGFWTD